MGVRIYAGPAGGGKSDKVAELSNDFDVIIDTGKLRAALFPLLAGIAIGEDLTEVVRFVQWVRWAAIRHAGEAAGRLPGDIVVTTSNPTTIDRILQLTGGERNDVTIVDPGRSVVLERLQKSQGQENDAACEAAVDRWYGRL